MFSPNNAAEFAIHGSRWIKDGVLPEGLVGYAMHVKSDEATFTSLDANGLDTDSAAVFMTTTFEKGEYIFGIGDITGFTVTGTVQLFLISNVRP